MRLHRNVWDSLERLEKFIFTEWVFHNTKSMELSKAMSPIDKERFFIDINTLVWEDYFVNLTQGVRRYLNHEKPSSLPAARSKDTVLLFLHLALQGLIHSGVWFLASWLLGVSMSKCAFVVPVSYILCGFL